MHRVHGFSLRSDKELGLDEAAIDLAPAVLLGAADDLCAFGKLPYDLRTGIRFLSDIEGALGGARNGLCEGFCSLGCLLHARSGRSGRLGEPFRCLLGLTETFGCLFARGRGLSCSALPCVHGLPSSPSSSSTGTCPAGSLRRSRTWFRAVVRTRSSSPLEPPSGNKKAARGRLCYSTSFRRIHYKLKKCDILRHVQRGAALGKASLRNCSGMRG